MAFSGKGKEKKAIEPRRTRRARRCLAALGRNQKFVQQGKHHNLLCIKMLQSPTNKIEHEKQRSAGL
jgi:hypothetical protein